MWVRKEALMVRNHLWLIYNHQSLPYYCYSWTLFRRVEKLEMYFKIIQIPWIKNRFEKIVSVDKDVTVSRRLKRCSQIYLDLWWTWTFTVIWSRINRHSLALYITHLVLEKWPPFCTQYIHMHFHECKILYFNSNCTEVCSWGSYW